MRVFADKHHGALTYSLQLLFEKRFGAEFYQPIGLEWWTNRFWAVFDARDTAEQWLGLSQSSPSPFEADGNFPASFQNLNNAYPQEDGIYYTRDFVYRTIQRSITLEKFKNTKFDIIIATMPQHIGPFMELQRLYQPQAKLIFQAGNAWNPDPRIKNFMGSISPCRVPADTNAVFYHQEMDAVDFRYEPPTNLDKVYSFVHYMSGKSRMNQIAAELPAWTFKSYGAGMEGDSLGTMRDVGDKMREAAFIFHDKFGADGFGHSIHGAFSVGRPVICSTRQYSGKLASALMVHNKTCIDIDQIGASQAIAARLAEIVSTEEHRAMCEAAHNRFQEVVNYDREFEDIKRFVENLK